jgi:3-hydroxybutyryl-CoA dehydrogenase
MKTIGVIGAGQMGAGIAQIAATQGLQVLLADVSEDAARAGKARISASLEKAVSREKLHAADRDAILGWIEAVPSLEPLKGADLIIEAASEREAVKRDIFETASRILGDESVLATNTSSISITRLAQSVSDPARFIGMHFFNPVPTMPLLELIRGVATSDATVERAKAFGKITGKTAIVAADSPGFVVNRILIPLLNEACFAAGERLASISDIDAGVKLGLGHPMGPLSLADLIGLDTLLEILRVFQADFGDQKYRPAPILMKLVDAGWLGKKSGRGFFDYSTLQPVPSF